MAGMGTGSSRRLISIGVAALLGTGVAARAVELLVSSAQTAQVLRYNGNTGAFMDVFISGGGLANPRGLLLGSDGNVYVASFSNDTVKRYDGTTGAYIGDFVTPGSGGLDGPDSMAWGPDGNLYVSSNLNHKILRYQGLGGATPGAFMGTFVPASSGGLSGPRGILFGNDQWTGGAPGPAQDGYPELLVCSGSAKILRYNGKTGAFLDDYGVLPGGQFPLNLIYEWWFNDNERFNQLGTGNLLVSTTGGALQIWSGTFADHEASYDTFFGNFFAGLNNPRGLAWGPDRNGDLYQELYVGNGTQNNVYVVGNNESDQGALFPSGTGGLSTATYVLFKCGRNKPTLIRKVLGNAGMAGTVHTVTLQGDNLAALTNVRLRRMKNTGAVANDGTAVIPSIPGTVQMVGQDLQASFDLTGAEAGRYAVVPVDSCSVAMWFADAVLVYLPELTNGGFEEGYVADRENRPVCVDLEPWPGGWDKSRPKHWDARRYLGASDQMSVRRDGGIWSPCTQPPGQGSVAVGKSGLHYGTLQSNATDNSETVMFQTIAAPKIVEGVSTAPYSIYADVRVASAQGESFGLLRLIDGTDKSGHVIAETQLPNTQWIDPDAIVRSPMFSATVPGGYIYESDPPTLTIMFILHSVPGDEGTGHALKAMHLDSVRTSYFECPRSPWGDVDEDGDIDQVDFAAFQRCLTITGPAAEETCKCFDRDLNENVDGADFVFFVNCSTGPGLAGPLPLECE